MTSDSRFTELVSLACHDLRTPLATVHGFARTLLAMDGLGERESRYIGLIDAASEQLTELLEELGLLARIEAGRYEPVRLEADTLALARAAAARLGDERAGAGGAGGRVSVELEPTKRAVAALGLCALRHGGLARVELVARGVEIALAPVTEAAAPVVLGEELRDLGAATARRVVEAQGGSLRLEDERLLIRLPGVE